MKEGDRVQVWDSDSYKCLGWGTITKLAHQAKDISTGERSLDPIPLIELESGVKIWGDRCDWITEKKVAEIGVRLFRDIYEKSR